MITQFRSCVIPIITSPGHVAAWALTVFRLEFLEGKQSACWVFTKNSPAAILSALKHPHGELLTQQETAVEILNLIRPLVAISVYFVFTLHSLHAHPEYKKKIKNSNRMRRLFIQEVRRFYPFFPTVIAKSKRIFEIDGFLISKNRQLVLDLHGTNRDPNSWANPDRFFPERYLTEMMSPFNFVPHGGGEAYKTHRCPGEDPSAMLIEQFLSQILHLFDFEIKTSENLDTTRIPPLPESRLTLVNFQKVQAPPYTERPSEISP